MKSGVWGWGGLLLEREQREMGRHKRRIAGQCTCAVLLNGVFVGWVCCSAEVRRDGGVAWSGEGLGNGGRDDCSRGARRCHCAIGRWAAFVRARRVQAGGEWAGAIGMGAAHRARLGLAVGRACQLCSMRRRDAPSLDSTVR